MYIYTNAVFKSTYEYESYIFCIFVVQFRWWRSIREDGGSGGGGPYAKSGNLRIHQTQGASKRCYVARTPTVSNRPKVPRDSEDVGERTVDKVGHTRSLAPDTIAQ